MDEVPCYYDMARDTTLHFKGAKNVDGVDTGYSKQRYTVCLAVSLDGKILKTLIVFRNLKKIPNVKCKNNRIILAVNKSGSMDAPLCKKWIDLVFCTRGNYLCNVKSLLIWDSYGSHKRDDVVDYLKRKCGSEMLLIPSKTTCFTQPLDVGVNAAFKAFLKSEWDAWQRDGPKEYTPSGNRKRPSYQAIIDMVSNAIEQISQDTVKRAFECCGIAAHGAPVSQDRLNERFRHVLSWQQSSGLVPADLEEDDDGDSDDEELVPREDDANSDDEDEDDESDDSDDLIS
jgi:hypothetical protein